DRRAMRYSRGPTYRLRALRDGASPGPPTLTATDTPTSFGKTTRRDRLPSGTWAGPAGTRCSVGITFRQQPCPAGERSSANYHILTTVPQPALNPFQAGESSTVQR